MFTSAAGCVFTSAAGCVFTSAAGCVFTSAVGCVFTSAAGCVFTSAVGCVFAMVLVLRGDEKRQTMNSLEGSFLFQSTVHTFSSPTPSPPLSNQILCDAAGRFHGVFLTSTSSLLEGYFNYLS